VLLRHVNGCKLQGNWCTHILQPSQFVEDAEGLEEEGSSEEEEEEEEEEHCIVHLQTEVDNVDEDVSDLSAFNMLSVSNGEQEAGTESTVLSGDIQGRSISSTLSGTEEGTATKLVSLGFEDTSRLWCVIVIKHKVLKCLDNCVHLHDN
jgi:hypothetical protein